MAEVGGLAKHRQPAASPHKVSIDWIPYHGDEESIDHERGEPPAFGHGARWNGGRGVHKHHLEEEHREHADIIDAVPQEESLRAENAEAAYGKLVSVKNPQ